MNKGESAQVHVIFDGGIMSDSVLLFVLHFILHVIFIECLNLQLKETINFS